MASVTSVLRKTCGTFIAAAIVYCIALLALTNFWLQRHVLYAHKVHTGWLQDVSKPEQFGFAKNQVTPFKFSTPDNETLYAWHVMPLGLYAKHEAEILKETSGCAKDITKTKAFGLMEEGQETRLVISFHGNAGSVAQGWRTDIYRALSDGSTSDIHILAPDYRGFGYSTGSPTEEGLIIDGIATVNWALQVARIPPERIVIVGHSLGTAVTLAVVEDFAKNGTEFAGIVLIAGFTDLPNLLTSYAIGGWVPVLSPLKRSQAIQKWFKSFIVDKWPSATRLANFVRLSQRVRLFLIHAKNDYEIPCSHSDGLFAAAANATTAEGMEGVLLSKMKARSTVSTGEGSFLTTWKAGGNKVIQEQIVSYGGHNRIMTYAPVALAVLKAFEIESGTVFSSDESDMAMLRH